MKFVHTLEGRAKGEEDLRIPSATLARACALQALAIYARWVALDIILHPCTFESSVMTHHNAIQATHILFSFPRAPYRPCDGMKCRQWINAIPALEM